MLLEILKQSWDALWRNPTRSLLTMLGIVWGIASVTLLMAYGNSFRGVLMTSFDAFGKSAVVVWPGQTSQQAGGERAGRRIQLEQADLEAVRQGTTLVKQACLESVNRTSLVYGERLANAAVRAVCPAYGEIRNEVPSEGRWISAEDMQERRRVIFLGNKLKQKLFSGRDAIGETLTVSGVRFIVIGVMANKLQLSNYFSSDDDSAFVPYTAASEVWNTRYASVLVFSSVAPRLEKAAIRQVRDVIGRRQGFAATDERALQMFGRDEFRPVLESITIGLQVLLLFIGGLTLGIGGVGVMNITLVSVEERIREIGLRMALGARRRHIRMQFLAEALALTMMGGFFGILFAYAISLLLGPLPLLSGLMKDDSGKGDIILRVDLLTTLVATCALMLVGVVSGIVPAIRASRLDPSDALRHE